MTAELSTIICATIAALSALSVAVVERRADKERKTATLRAERRARESRLSMDLMSASCELAMVTAVAMREGHTNGTLEPALSAARDAQEKYRSFLKDEAARAVSKV